MKNRCAGVEKEGILAAGGEKKSSRKRERSRV